MSGSILTSSTMIAPEIVDRILGFLQPDHTTLKTCSTVFPSLVDRHLYSHIRLCTPVMNEDTEAEEGDLHYAVQFPDFLEQVARRPKILLCILGVRVVIAVMPAPLDHMTLQFLPTISNLLAIFPLLQSIELRGTWGNISWNALGPDFCTAFQKCLRIPSINQVTISNIDDFPLDSFDDCKSLEKLVLGCKFTDGEGVSTSSYPRLSSLRIESQSATDSTKVVSWMTSHTLQSLSLRIRQSMDLNTFQALIGACSATLVILELDLSECVKVDYADTSTGTTYPQFPLLTFLILHFVVSDISSPDEPLSFLPNFAPFLIALSRNSSPHSVHLSVRLRFRTLPLIRRGDSTDLKWPDITFLDGLPVFRQPIELRLVGPRFAMARFGYLFDQSSEVQKLLANQKLTMIDDSE